MEKYNTINDYLADFPEEAQEIMEQVREVILKAAPEAAEKISYGIPTFTLNGGNLVHFGGYKHHIGFYPTPSAIVAFGKELASYQKTKGAVQFPIDKPMPLALISKMVKFRVQESNAKYAAKGKKSPATAKETPARQERPKDFLSLLSAPAKRALESQGIITLKRLASFSEAEILELHGMGKSSIPKLREALEKEGLGFREE